MATVGTLKPFDSSVDDVEVWVRAFNSFLLANNVDKAKEDAKCVAILLSSIGLPVVSVLSSLFSPDFPEDKPLAEVIKMLTEHYKPAPKAIAERFRFMSRKQQQGESVNQFLADLRKLAATCKFTTELSWRLRDQLVFGLRSEQAQKQLFTKPDDIKLDDVVKLAVAQELSEQSLSVVRGNSSSTSQKQQQDQVNKVNQPKGKKGRKFSQQQPKSGNSNSENSPKPCSNCGSKQHSKARDCPHKDVVCFKCNKSGHFAKFCLSNKSFTSPQTKPAASAKVVDIRTADVHTSTAKQKKKIWISVEINGVPHPMELDTGCERSLLSETFWKEGLGAPSLTKSDLTFRTYTNQLFHAKGDIFCKLQYRDQIIEHVFPVTSGSSLFGRDLLRVFKIDWSSVASQCNHVNQNLSLDNLLREFSDRFQEPQGHIQNFKARIILKDDAVPKFMKPRPIPYAIQKKVDDELDLMERAGVIEKIDHSEWASPMVVVPKPNGRVRITGDYKNTVNSQLHITQYPLQNPERLFHTVNNCTKYSKMDGFNAYHQMEVEESCKKFLVVNTHRGLYHYNVLPQGIASSPAIFQEFADKMLQGITRSGSYIDDVICGGASENEHLHTLKSIFSRMREYNYFISREKCEFMQEHVEFLGHILSKRGIHTSPRKIEAMEAIPPPQNVTEVKSFLGLVNFYSKFVPNFSDICEPLYRLTRSEVEWKWSNKCQSAFDRVKSELSRSPVLINYDPELPVGITCDASSKGIGCVLFHRVNENNSTIERPIAYASRILSPAEQNYSQIEKEGLSIIFALKKFYKFLCGRRFILVTDHKPLLSIFGPKTSLQSYAAARLHRWSVYMSQFDYSIEYRKTDHHGNADALSRLPQSTTSDNSDDDDSSEVNIIASESLEALPVNVKSIRNSTARDKELSKVIQLMQSSWPSKLNNDDVELQPFFSRREELSLQQGVIMWGVRVVVPSSLRSKLLSSLHETHAGIVRMKALARQYIWWPKIDSAIESAAKSCSECCSTRPDPPSAPLHPWQFPERPWQRLHVDLAGPMLNNKMFLIVVDAHSKWPEVYDLNVNSTSTSVITRLRDSFVRFGIPEQIVSDNGRQFVSQEFQVFCKNNGIRHITSSANHPRTNGEAERFIQTFKKAMYNSKVELTLRVQSFLFHYRITPHASTGISPSELLLRRKPRSLMDLLKPDVKTTVSASQARQEAGYNHRVRARLFVEGEEVWVKTYSKDAAKWSLGTVIKQLGPVSYIVKVGEKEYKRHVDQINPATKLFITPAVATTPVPVSPPRHRHKSEPVSAPKSPEEEFQSPHGSSDESEVFGESPPPPAPVTPPVPVPPRVYPQRIRKQPDRYGSV